MPNSENGSEDSPSVIGELSPEEVYIQVGITDDAKDAIYEFMEDYDTNKHAIHFVNSEDEQHKTAYIAIQDGGLWGVAPTPDGTLREGPIQRENILAAAHRSDAVHIICRDEAPFTGEFRTLDT